MKRFVVLVASLVLTVISLGAEPAEIDGTYSGSAPHPAEFSLTMSLEKAAPDQKITPSWIFSKLPTAITTSYYDYFIGSYNNWPLYPIPSSAGGGYFLTWQGKAASTSDRRVYYSYLDSAGNIISAAQIEPYSSGVQGWSAIAVDPVSGKPFYAWTQNVDADPEAEIVLTSDAFISGIAGLFNPPVTVIDNPVTITAPNGTVSTYNVFLWPSLVIGPSPVANKRRVYVLGRQNRNVYLALADFDAADIEDGNTLNWQYNSVPLLNSWAADTTLRRVSLALEADHAGNLILAGYHTSEAAEPDIDVFICSGFGQGNWTHHSFSSELPSWNPGGYFTDDHGVPYSDDELHWKLMNSGHLNAALDSNGRLHIVGLWGLATVDGYYIQDLQFLKEAVFDPVFSTFEIKDIYPQKSFDDTFNACFTPWDREPPYSFVDQFMYDPDGNYYPLMFKDWPFPHWDQTAHDDAMMFNYNNLKITRSNAQGQMAVVWQDSYRARLWNHIQAPGYEAYANSSDICIAYSEANGSFWLDPIVLNNVDIPQLAGVKPMWVYPAEQILFAGYSNGTRYGKLGLMFYNDFTWGANVLTPPYHANPDGGEVMFMELLIGYGWDSDDPGQTPVPAILAQNYPNPFNPRTSISFELLQAAPARLDIYDLRGRTVKTLLDSALGTGQHSLEWDGRDDQGEAVASGVYFYRLSTGGQSVSRKMVLLK